MRNAINEQAYADKAALISDQILFNYFIVCRYIFILVAKYIYRDVALYYEESMIPDIILSFKYS